MKERFRRSIVCLFIAVLLSSSSVFAAEFVPPQKKDKCPVCGMFVYKYKKWVAEIVFNDGTHRLFDGCKDMFKYYFKMKKYERKLTKEDVSDIYVTEYYTTKIMKADDLYFIVGSDVLGPMGREFIPVQGETKAKIFKLDHGGKKIYRFNEITPETIPR